MDDFRCYWAILFSIFQMFWYILQNNENTVLIV